LVLLSCEEASANSAIPSTSYVVGVIFSECFKGVLDYSRMSAAAEMAVSGIEAVEF
jgi:hypothetical protein